MKQMDKLFISNYNKDLAGKSTPYFQKTWNHSKRLEFQPHSLTSDEDKNSILKVYNFVNSIKDLSELYYYWKLTGGRIQTNVQSDVKSIRDYNDCRKPESIKESESVANDVDFTYLLPPILRIPHYLAIVKSNSSRVISSEEQWPSNEIRQPRTFQLKITPLSSRRFIERISRTPLHNLYPLLICRDFKTTQTGNNNVCAALYSFSKNNSNRSVPSELLSTLRSSVKHNPVLLESNKSRPDFLNLLFTNDLACDLGVDWCMSSTNDDYESNVNSISQQPLSVRETDVDYQIVRTRLFTRILNGLPATKQYLRLEARKDIPPFLRWKVWAALLEVYPNREFESSYLKALYEIRKLGLEVSPTDEFNNTEQNNDSNKNSDFNCDLLDEKVLNQISVDLPRCHAYDPLLASPVGQSVLRRVLIATLLMKPGALDYTQGMDSIAAVFLDRQINFKSLGLEKICTILSNFPDFNLDKCRTDALKLALATPRSLTAWSIPNKQCSNGESMEAVGLISQNNFSKEVSNLVNTKENTPSTCDFYTRLTLQNAWPDHLEYSSSESSEDIDTNTLSSVCEKYNISLNASKLVSILSAKDALEHIKRPDCLVLDLRNSKEYDKFHLPNSVHCDLSKCMTLDSPLSGTESSDILSPIESYHDISLENWEMIDFPSWNRNRPQIIPEFLANLMNQKLWRQATQARQSVNLNSSQGTANESTNIVIPSSPGLLIVFGNDERLCWHLAYWLIKHDIDRVCILSNINSVLSTFLNSCFQ
ncbi:unnamed protein product [Heterobilharzia americana]|nr:unnamed protein product [Heterobilharzia americana]